MKKKTIAFLTILIGSLSLVSCGGETVSSQLPSSQAPGYNIEWRNHDGTLLEKDTNVQAGVIPTYNGTTPIKAGTAQFSYEFSGWNPTIVAVTANATYTALFSEETNQYTLTFNTNQGSTIAPITVDYGTKIAAPISPTREGYRFVAWTSDVSLNNEVVWPLEMTENKTVYAKWNEQVPYATYLVALLENYSLNPLSYFPESMHPGANLVASTQANLDFTTNTNISDITYLGHGEQWNMVLTNIEQSMLFFDVLSIIDTLSGASIAAFNNYLDSNPENAAVYQFTQGIYQVTINFEDNVLYYVLDYTMELPVFGVQTIQIALEFNILTLKKVGRIQIGNAHALRYEMEESSYKFAIKYLGVRRAYFEIERANDGDVTGQIFEYLDVELTTISSSAQFFIGDDYVSVVGNKSSGMMAWTGYINEVYLVETGKLCGYEVRETLSVITYNTLWFNLDDVAGINSIRREVAPVENSNPDLIYVNGSANVFSSKLVGGLNPKLASRRYDIEFRTQYFYFLEGENLMKLTLEVPMLFVQQENYNTLKNDIESSNSGTVSGFSITLPATQVNKITSDYSTLIDAFIIAKDDYSIEMIISFIGEAYTH